MSRLQQLRDWASAQLHSDPVDLAPASEDASFRRYFRIATAEGTVIAMDAPPPQEDCRPYVAVAQLFHAAGINVPRVLAQDIGRGFLLLSDLGSTTYLMALNAGTAPELYRDATDTLLRLQQASRAGVLPEYDARLLQRELRLFPDWYIAKHARIALSDTQATVLESTFELVLANNLAEPQVFVHRDYHSRNLMLTAPNPGVLDFQDAVFGPISYDLVSLFKDAYVSWDEERVLDWLIRYWEKARRAQLPLPAEFSAFYRDFEWMGVQRHLKVLGIFARLAYRDGKQGFLKDLPLVMEYLRNACRRYRELAPMARLLDELEQRKVSSGYTF